MNGWWSVRAAALALAPLLVACSAQSGSDTGSSDRDGDVPARHSSPSATDPSTQPLPDGVSFTQSVRTLEDGSPVRTSVLTVAQSAPVDIEGVHGGSVASTDTVRDLARRAGAVAAVNGTFFNSDSERYKGDPLGLYVSRGILQSEAAGGRTALILPGAGERPRITELSSATRVTSSDGARAVVDGTDRVPGRIVGCGEWVATGAPTPARRQRLRYRGGFARIPTRSWNSPRGGGRRHRTRAGAASRRSSTRGRR